MNRIIAVATLFVALNTNAQITGTGLQIKGQTSSQLRKIPNDFKYGRSGTGHLRSLAADIFIDYTLNNKFKLRLKAGYEQKGYTNKNYYYFPDATIGELNQIGKFSYISSDLLINYYFTDNNFKPYALIGISTGYLLDKSFSPNTGIAFTDYLSAIEFTEQIKNYSDFNLGTVIGFGLDFKNLFCIETEFNADLISPSITNNLKIKHHTFSINAGVNILELFKK